MEGRVTSPQVSFRGCQSYCSSRSFADMPRHCRMNRPVGSKASEIHTLGGRLPSSRADRASPGQPRSLGGRLDSRVALSTRALFHSSVPRPSAISRCAGPVGYESEAAFNRACKREFGEPPARWRKASPQVKLARHFAGPSYSPRGSPHSARAASTCASTTRDPRYDSDGPKHLCAG